MIRLPRNNKEFQTNPSKGMDLLLKAVSSNSSIQGDVSYVHNQGSPSTTWTITHGLNKFPSVTIVDSADNIVYGDVLYVSQNEVEVTFNASFSGKAYLN